MNSIVYMCVGFFMEKHIIFFFVCNQYYNILLLILFLILWKHVLHVVCHLIVDSGITLPKWFTL